METSRKETSRLNARLNIERFLQRAFRSRKYYQRHKYHSGQYSCDMCLCPFFLFLFLFLFLFVLQISAKRCILEPFSLHSSLLVFPLRDLVDLPVCSPVHLTTIEEEAPSLANPRPIHPPALASNNASGNKRKRVSIHSPAEGMCTT